MFVKRKGETVPRFAACTLLPYDPQFDTGGTLKEASQSVALDHPHCARFCVLGGASCSAYAPIEILLAGFDRGLPTLKVSLPSMRWILPAAT